MDLQNLENLQNQYENPSNENYANNTNCAIEEDLGDIVDIVELDNDIVELNQSTSSAKYKVIPVGSRYPSYHLSGKYDSNIHQLMRRHNAAVIEAAKFLRNKKMAEDDSLITVVFADQKLGYVSEIVANCPEESYKNSEILYCTNVSIEQLDYPSDFLVLHSSDITIRILDTIFPFMVSSGYTYIMFDFMNSNAVIENVIKYTCEWRGFFKKMSFIVKNGTYDDFTYIREKYTTKQRKAPKCVIM